MNSLIPLITTTTRAGHNPGDTFIGVGLQWLFEQARGETLRWALVNRFDANDFRDRKRVLQSAPFVVYGGMPQYNNYDEWIHWYDDRMWRRFIIRWGLKVYTIAGGAGSSAERISVEEYVKDCVESRKTRRVIGQRVEPSLCFTVRDPYAHALLNALDIPNAYLPCSATWATRMWGIAPADERPYLFIVPPHPRHRPGRDIRSFERQWAAIYAAFKDADPNTKVLCHGTEEYQALRGTIVDDDLWHHGDSYTLLREYARARLVVSARLHGSLPAFGLIGTRTLNLSVDTRGSAVEPFPKIRNRWLYDLSPVDLVDEAQDLEPSTEDDLALWEARYRAIIRDSLPSSTA